MTRGWKRRFWTLAVVLGAGSVFQIFPTSCANYWGQILVGGIDFCAFLNCTGSTYFDICTPVPYLVDCPNANQQQP